MRITSTKIGLSPRGRSHLREEDFESPGIRSISAWAESSWSSVRASTSPEVYLRVGGVIVCIGANIPPVQGLSPRGRSHHSVDAFLLKDEGSISAWAESSTHHVRDPNLDGVYLRVGGVILVHVPPILRHHGLSPRGRSHHAQHLPQRSHARSISAWAESSSSCPHATGKARVYLRVGGVIPTLNPCRMAKRGLSPRGRSHL